MFDMTDCNEKCALFYWCWFWFGQKLFIVFWHISHHDEWTTMKWQHFKITSQHEQWTHQNGANIIRLTPIFCNYFAAFCIPIAIFCSFGRSKFQVNRNVFVKSIKITWKNVLATNGRPSKGKKACVFTKRHVLSVAWNALWWICHFQFLLFSVTNVKLCSVFRLLRMAKCVLFENEFVTVELMNNLYSLALFIQQIESSDERSEICNSKRAPCVPVKRPLPTCTTSLNWSSCHES